MELNQEENLKRWNFFGQGPVRYETAVDNKCLQQLKYSPMLGI